MAWPDIGRGLSILGVVLLHASTSIPAESSTIIQPLNEALTPVRLPLFFLISGYFSGKVLRQSLSELCVKRLWFFLVPYLVWASVDIVQSAAASTAMQSTGALTFAAWGDRVLQGITVYWFFQMLVVANLFLWLTRRLNTFFVLIASLAPLLLLAQEQMVPDWQFKIMVFVPIFMLGARGKDLVTVIADFSHHPLVATGLIAMGVLIEARYRVFRGLSSDGALFDPMVLGPAVIDQNDVNILVEFIYRLALIPTAVAVAVVVSKLPGITTFVQFLGRNTLVFYIGHPLGMFAFMHLFTVRGIDFEPHLNLWFLLQLAMCLTGCAAVYFLSMVPVAGWIVAPPPIAKFFPRLRGAGAATPTTAAAGAPATRTSTTTG
ncbi:acyltransferase family protein [Corynebacterium aquilae]|uniref:acyltransferase family protein n=1 Tax=Corynebacterium aquilae TaxID=203263 RepID=UPI000950BC71|nr:acyltransferase family protein [Corynebacterium aquilae]